MDENLISRILDEKGWNVLDELGYGRYGFVYKIEDRKSHKVYAVKVMIASEDPDDDDDFSETNIEDLDKEIRILGKLTEYKQCGLVPCLHSTFRVQKRGRMYAFIIMDYIEGKTLNNIWEDLSIEERKNIMKLIILGIKTLQSIGFIHLDLHGNNIMITKNMNVYFLDFGISCIQQPCWAPIGGWYTPPEHNKNDEKKEYNSVFSELSDIYQLGLLFGELILQSDIIKSTFGDDIYERCETIQTEWEKLKNKDEYSYWRKIIPQMVKCNPIERPTASMILREYETGEIISVKEIIEINNKLVHFYKESEGSDIIKTSSLISLN